MCAWPWLVPSAGLALLGVAVTVGAGPLITSLRAAAPFGTRSPRREVNCGVDAADVRGDRVPGESKRVRRGDWRGGR